MARKRKVGHVGVPKRSHRPPRAAATETAHVAWRKDTMVSQAADGARVRWGVTKPKVKRR